MVRVTFDLTKGGPWNLTGILYTCVKHWTGKIRLPAGRFEMYPPCFVPEWVTLEGAPDHQTIILVPDGKSVTDLFEGHGKVTGCVFIRDERLDGGEGG